MTEDLFPDHAVLKATFAAQQSQFVRYLWPSPLPVPWQSVPDIAQPVDFQHGDPTAQYASLWQERKPLRAKPCRILGRNKCKAVDRGREPRNVMVGQLP